MRGFGTFWRAVRLLLLTASVGGCLVPYHARSGGVAADSAATEGQVLRAVKADQAAFEEWRRKHLPIRVVPTETRPRCHEPVGRFCLEEGTGYGAWWDLEMKAPIDRERAKLIRALHEVGRRVPEDDWVVGQFVRYTVEAGRIGEAAAAALNCGGTAWWCFRPRRLRPPQGRNGRRGGAILRRGPAGDVSG